MPTVKIGANTTDDYAGQQTNHLTQDFSTSNNGTSTTTQIAFSGTTNERRTLLRFDGLTSISGPVTVSSATLYLYLSGATGVATHTATFYEVLRSWVETTSTWNIWDTGNNWTTAGCKGVGTDRDSTVIGTMSIGVTAFNWMSFSSANLAALCQDIINGVKSNTGLIGIRTDSSNDGEFRTFNSDNAGDGTRPYIQLTYAAAAGTVPKHKILTGPFGGPLTGAF